MNERGHYFTDTRVVLTIMVWNCVGSEPSEYKLEQYKLM